MKNIIILFISVLFLLPTTGCKKTKKSAPIVTDTIDPYPRFFTAQINGVPWVADSCIGNIIEYPNDSGKYNLTFTATKIVNGVGTEMDMFVTNFTGVGSYNINPPAVTATYYVNTVRHYATSGSINITLDDSSDTLNGNFNFVADSLTVDSGAISIVL